MTKPTTAECIELFRYLAKEPDWASQRHIFDAAIGKLLAAEKDAKDFDANVDRLKACEHIAYGEEGWEKLENECPSTAAVARLRKAADEMAKALDNTVNISAICHPQVARGEYLIDKKTMQQNAKSLTDYRNAGGK